MRRNAREVVVVIGFGSIVVAIARRVGAGGLSCSATTASGRSRPPPND
ncbi:hypothetical protein KBP30_41415 [Streptomyces sp. Go40/10]|nr:hypothetical protein [Streptomyces sp. Go40/10]UFR07647.1 hypothetical protein KBP30_00190 [Streptomyces sp. Go40/10]UFR07669.1 hypothetical protein KBP30_41415 [Streptomyces sp. Go40/10]